MSSHATPIGGGGGGSNPDPNEPIDLVPVFVSFADWVPGLCSTLGMIIVNLIVSISSSQLVCWTLTRSRSTQDKQKLADDDESGGNWGGGSVAWRARLFLFMGSVFEPHDQVS